MNRDFKKIFFIGILGLLLLIVSVFLFRRSSISNIVTSSIDFKDKNYIYIDSILLFLDHTSGSGNRCDNTIINFYWRKQYVSIVCKDSSSSERKAKTPSFLRTVFFDNDGNSLLVGKDGILFYTLYHSHSFKKFSVKYFYKPHNLKIGDVYLDKYDVVPPGDIGSYKLACSIIDDYWILIQKSE